MTDRTPVKAIISSGNAVGLAEYATGDTTPIAHGGTGATTENAGADALGAFRRGTILGTVSQSGGVPTGAIIETGSNANGTYYKYAGGMMVTTRIWLADQNVAPGQAINVATHAAPFVGDHVVTGNCLFYAAATQGGNRLYGSTFSLSTTAISYMNTGQSPDLVNPSFTLGATTALSFRLSQTVVGRWY